MEEQSVGKPGDPAASAAHLQTADQAAAIQTALLTIDLDTLTAVLAAKKTAARKRLEKAHRRVRTIQSIRARLSSAPASPLPSGFDAVDSATFLNQEEARARLRFQSARAALANLGKTNAPMRRLRQLAQAIADAAPEQKASRAAMSAAQIALMPEDQ